MSFSLPASGSMRVLALVLTLVGGGVSAATEKHYGLLQRAQNEVVESGRIQCIVTDSNAFTAKFVLGGTALSVKGVLAGNPLSATVPANFPGATGRTLTIHSTAAPGRVVEIVLSDPGGDWSTTLVRSSYSAAQPYTDAGAYTMRFSPPAPPNGPLGTGHATVRIDASGVATFTCTQGDAFSTTFTAPVCDDGTLPVYAPLLDQGRKGMLLGTLRKRPAATTDLDGTLLWKKLSTSLKSARYKDGIDQTLSAEGCAYAKPSPGQRVIETLETDPNVQLSFAELVTPRLPDVVGWLDRANHFKPRAGAAGIALTLNLATGRFAGSARDYLAGASKSVPFTGVVLQKMKTGAGHYLARNATAGMDFKPLTAPLAIAVTTQVLVSRTEPVAGARPILDIDSTGPVVKYGISGADTLLANFSFDSSTGLLSGQPLVSGPRDVVVWVEDASGQRVYRVVRLNFPATGTLRLLTEGPLNPNPATTGVGYVVETIPASANRNLEYHLIRHGHHFASVFVDRLTGQQAFVVRTHPGVEPDGWGASLYLHPAFPIGEYRGASLDEPAVNPGNTGIAVSANGLVVSDVKGDYGTWTGNYLFAYDPTAKTCSIDGTCQIALKGPANAAPVPTGNHRDLNLFKLASNLLWIIPLADENAAGSGVPILSGGSGLTGDMKPPVGIYRNGTLDESWDPISVHATYPGAISAVLRIEMPGNFNEVDLLADGYLFAIKPAHKPSVAIEISSVTSALDFTFGGAYDTTPIKVRSKRGDRRVSDAFERDNIGINAQLRESADANFQLHVHIDSAADAQDGSGKQFELDGVLKSGRKTLNVYHATTPTGPFHTLAGTLTRVPGSTNHYTGTVRVPAELVGAQNYFVAH